MSADAIVISDLLFPAIVAVLAAFFSYYATYKLQSSQSEEFDRIRKLDLTDQILLDLEKLNVILENLKEDAEKLRFFSLTNTATARKLIDKLRGYFYQITLFKKDRLRKQIIETTDVADSLINEIDLIENHIVNERRRSNEAKSETKKALSTIRMELFKGNYFLDEDDNYRVNSFDKSIDPKKAEVLNKILVDLVEELNVSQNSVSDLDTEYEKKRTFIAMKILDLQSKLKELITSLENSRKK